MSSLRDDAKSRHSAGWPGTEELAWARWDTWFGTALPVFLFLVLSQTFDRLLRNNELLTIPWALQLVDPDWLPQDWLLNTPVGNQLLTATLTGALVKQFGFVYGAVLLRVISYGLLAAGLASLLRAVRIPAAYAVVALWVFLAMGQGIAAGEWIFRAAESKTFAYAWVFFGLAHLVERRYTWAYGFFGLATSFHFLVGGYTLLAALLLSLHERCPPRLLAKSLALFGAWAVVGIYNVAQELLAGLPPDNASYVLAYIRQPHHLAPATWEGMWPVRLALFIAAWIVVYLHARSVPGTRRLLLFGAFTIIPFGAGLAVAPFDHQGAFLQYFPFRLGDTLFPLIVLLGAYHVAVRWTNRSMLAPLLVLSACMLMVSAAHAFAKQARKFDGNVREQRPWVEVCEWIRQQTPRDVVVLTPPTKPSFTVLAQRATVFQFRFFPFTRAAIPEWHARLIDVTGGAKLEKTGFAAGPQLEAAYHDLTDAELARIARKYGAELIVARCADRLDLTLEYSNGTYCVYRPGASP